MKIKKILVSALLTIAMAATFMACSSTPEGDNPSANDAIGSSVDQNSENLKDDIKDGAKDVKDDVTDAVDDMTDGKNNTNK